MGEEHLTRRGLEEWIGTGFVGVIGGKERYRRKGGVEGGKVEWKEGKEKASK